jgi:hypothetical protein
MITVSFCSISDGGSNWGNRSKGGSCKGRDASGGNSKSTTGNDNNKGGIGMGDNNDKSNKSQSKKNRRSPETGK